MLLPLFNFAQQPYPMGLVLDDEAYAKLPTSATHITLDYGQKFSQSKVDLAPYCPEIRHQGEISSCVGWSAGYGAMTIERAVKNGWTNKQQISENANSALFVYNQINSGNCQRGISLPRALALLQDKGNCLARDFDFNVNDCGKEVTKTHLAKASQHRIEEYLPLFTLEAPIDEKIKNVKLLLAQKKPVIVGMQVLQNFYQIKDGEKSWWPNLGNTRNAGAHAMVVVGYDDLRFRKSNRKVNPNMEGAFKVMNSWGKNWGDRGFIWIRYAHFAKYCRHAFAIKIAEGSPIDLSYEPAPTSKTTTVQKTVPQAANNNTRSLRKLAGSFAFRQYDGYDMGHLFSEAPVQFSNGIYQLTGQRNLGDRFQLKVENGFEEGYIYVFSIDAAGKAEVHFPRSKTLNPKHENLNESALVFSSQSSLTIPSPGSVLKLSTVGTDHLVVLFSTQKIKDAYIHLLKDKLSSERSQLNATLHQILGPHMVPGADIVYKPKQMGFEVSSRSSGKIVPIVLQVKVQ